MRYKNDKKGKGVENMSYETKCFCDICNQELDELKEISIYINGKKLKEWQLCKEHYNFVYDLVLGLFDAVNVKISKVKKELKK